MKEAQIKNEIRSFRIALNACQIALSQQGKELQRIKKVLRLQNLKIESLGAGSMNEG